MSILSSPAFSGSSPAAALSLSPHPACGRKKAALPLILFQVLAVLFLFCGTVPASAQKGRCGNGSEWKIIDGTLTLSAIFGYVETCEWRNYSFSSVVINEGFTEIPQGIFEMFHNLESVSIPASVQSIGKKAFNGCENLKSVIIAEGSRLRTIGGFAFSDCYSLESLTIPASVMEIGEKAFQACSSLRSITIPASVTRIGERVFDNCTELTVTIERGDEPLTLSKDVFSGVNTISANLVYTGNDPGYFEITPETGFSISGNTLTWEGGTEEATLTRVSEADGVPGSGAETPGSAPAIRLFRFPDCRLPETGFSSRRPSVLSIQPKDVRYEPVEMRLQIPSLNVETELVTVPLKDNSWQVEWLSGRAGILDGTALPGEGFSVIAAHNTLNDTEYGPFALLGTLETDDLVTVADEEGSLKLFRVYANELLAPDDMETLAAIAGQVENVLVLVTCENESAAGGYLDRRAIFAKPIG